MKREREEDEHEHDEITKSSKICCSRRIAASDIYIHLDLKVEILKKLPAKSLLRFRCVSKQWLNIIGSRNFIDSIISRPLADPPMYNLHFIFHHEPPKPFFVFSSTYTYKEEQAVSIPRESQSDLTMYQYVRGLILCSSAFSPLMIIYNPTTRQSISLPDIESQSDRKSCYFGYLPVLNQYKVMCLINEKKSELICKVFTFGDPMKQWRNIQVKGNEINHSTILKLKLHINGIIYYGRASRSNNNDEDTLMSFDFNLERFYHINIPTAMTRNFRDSNFVNYKGKLGCLSTEFGEMWIMEDVEKQTWSKTIFELPKLSTRYLFECECFSGVNFGGDIFIVKLLYSLDGTLYVYYYNIKQNNVRITEIKSTTHGSKNRFITGVSDHVENIMSLHQAAGE